MPDQISTRRQFLKTCARCAGAAAVGAAAFRLVARADADKVWQLDSNACTVCKDFLNDDGWVRCATECVLKHSAVKVVNDFSICGYCNICPAYYDTTSYDPETDTYTKLLCPQDAIIRRPVGEVDEEDPNNNFFEYTIDESKCNGCGLCVTDCARDGNGSLNLQVRHNLCVDCNQCAIATACPPGVFYRARVTTAPAGYEAPPEPPEKGPPS